MDPTSTQLYHKHPKTIHNTIIATHRYELTSSLYNSTIPFYIESNLNFIPIGKITILINKRRTWILDSELWICNAFLWVDKRCLILVFTLVLLVSNLSSSGGYSWLPSSSMTALALFYLCEFRLKTKVVYIEFQTN